MPSCLVEFNLGKSKYVRTFTHASFQISTYFKLFMQRENTEVNIKSFKPKIIIHNSNTDNILLDAQRTF